MHRIPTQVRAATPSRKVSAQGVSLTAAALLLTAAAQPSSGDRFAIECTGTARFTDNLTGRNVTRNHEVPRQVYLFDEAAGLVQRALEPRQEFEDVCFRDGYIDSVQFSPGLIMVRSEKGGQMCDFQVSRATGEAEYFSHQDMPGGRFSQIEKHMTCSPTAIPVFDRSRNRF